ncbi:MAG TPA: hypothetical protein PKN56_21750 [Leptospiraceae bacterium]|nr:hypothetical protein [Leptospiraceae bacterium]HMY66233.1 hypothetical protein [Leptospiraceae bacterium]HNF27770.1 hypothetical protein [Leptospiraceae bacterium]HNI96147.1 hypothetical protein [Leptospiraceae bacterium]HNM04064.1 hypothetical protein [Leptospiraceae bacterium]
MKNLQKAYLLIIFIFSGCTITVEEPVGGTESIVLDPRILGIWGTEEQRGYQMILKDKEERNRYLLLEFDFKFGAHSQIFQLYVTKLNERTFLNYKPLHKSSTESDNSYQFVSYSVQDSQLKVVIPEQSILKKAVEEKKLMGTVRESLFGNTVQLTESVSNLKEFFVQNESLLFKDDKAVPFKRIDLK